jgi:hypothetical protein
MLASRPGLALILGSPILKVNFGSPRLVLTLAAMLAETLVPILGGLMLSSIVGRLTPALALAAMLAEMLGRLTPAEVLGRNRLAKGLETLVLDVAFGPGTLDEATDDDLDVCAGIVKIMLAGDAEVVLGGGSAGVVVALEETVAGIL